MTLVWRDVAVVRKPSKLVALLLGLFFGSVPLTRGAESISGTKIDFNREIRPILAENCFACHGPDAEHREAELRLDQSPAPDREVIVAGEPGRSELMARLSHADPELRMPPVATGKQLSAAQVDTMRRWIEQGAPYAAHWAYVPPRRPSIPDNQHPTWGDHWIDRLLYVRLAEAGMTPSASADRMTLIRRLSFDLTGLPPTYDEVQAYLADDRPNAYERIVDRLLASAHFGERMAAYWLDLVRFADTVGYHGDQDHNITPYRDWVIDAFNDNLPFDRFTAAQLAGDLLPDGNLDDVIASGYNRLLQTSHEGGVQPKEYLAIYAADRVRNISSVWLGGTLGCAQCHDHKFDPYTTRDFYAMAAFFADVDEAKHFSVGSNSLPTARPPEVKVLSRRVRSRLADLQLREQSLSAAGTESTEFDVRLRGELRAEIARLENSARLTMVTVATEPRVTRILPRGNWLDESGVIVEPAVPTFLGSVTGDRRPTRLELARWLTDPDDGVGKLTARVMVNRLWYMLFGTGLARRLDDLGGQGEAPSQPELLDRLALRLIDNGWDLKSVIKDIAMSQAYRQTSEVTAENRAQDPDNRLFGRQSALRLPAEMIRDHGLYVSRLLVDEMGGPSVKPYQPAHYYRHLNFPEREYQHDKSTSQWRRGLYIHWQRQYLHPMLKALDAPSREECTAERTQSSTPLAALTLLNDPTFVEIARAFAWRILTDGGSTDEERLVYAYRMALSRDCDVDEQQVLLQLLSENRRHYQADDAAAQALTGVGISAVDVSIEPTELAAWTMVSRAILNTNEFNSRN